MGSKNQNRCPKYQGKVGRDLGWDDHCQDCRLLKLCESKANKTLTQALEERHKEEEIRDQEREKEFAEALLDLGQDIKSIWELEEQTKRCLYKCKDDLFDLCINYGFPYDNDPCDFVEGFLKDLKKQHRREQKERQRKLEAEAHAEALEMQYELDHRGMK